MQKAVSGGSTPEGPGGGAPGPQGRQTLEAPGVPGALGSPGSRGAAGALEALEAETSYQGPPVVVMGDALDDYVCRIDAMPQPGGDAELHSMEHHPGGAGLNTAVALAALGVRCALVAGVGDDRRGQALAQYLERAGVEVGLLARGGTTGYVLSMADARGERTMFSYRGAAAIPLAMTRELEEALERTPLLFVSGYGLLDSAQAQTYLGAARRVKRNRGLVAWDPTPVVGRVAPAVLEAMQGLTDLLLLNEAELHALCGTGSWQELLPALLDRFPAVGLKRGAQGSVVAMASRAPETERGRWPQSGTVGTEGARTGRLQHWVCPPVAVTPVDTTGAGDAFNAGFIAAMLRGVPPQQWGEWGNKLAARIVSRVGACLVEPDGWRHPVDELAGE